MPQTLQQRKDLEELRARVAEHRRLYPKLFEIVEDALTDAGFMPYGKEKTITKGQESWPEYMRQTIYSPGYFLAYNDEGLSPNTRVAVFFSEGGPIEEAQGKEETDRKAHLALTLYMNAMPSGLETAIERHPKHDCWRLIVVRPDGWTYTPKEQP